MEPPHNCARSGKKARATINEVIKGFSMPDGAVNRGELGKSTQPFRKAGLVRCSSFPSPEVSNTVSDRMCALETQRILANARSHAIGKVALNIATLKLLKYCFYPLEAAIETVLTKYAGLRSPDRIVAFHCSGSHRIMLKAPDPMNGTT
ncbi:hypothetical protein IVB18_41435 [Bradyrhizobium sp. 186]|uniref:hypothetical protein n=1 Tax=Bradyrhizobium sp. 186 TaxID=2782654 RepID=UPI0020017792|nr:hypothetical protein [Bradyrhizobium sp. 186]UPK34485.1 hypothetical protein IVB18_41435 [Bradyrhizobium sp. 186]